jgi:ribosomal protein L11 methyltransferase
LTRPGGQIALSGILVEQADTVLEAYAPQFTMTRAATDEGWVLLTGSRR